jgi:HAD superfamily hydrolase (TIGR01509 family)
LEDVFQVVVGPEDVPRLKPAPDMLRVALARLDVAPQEALYVGDMVVDVETAPRSLASCRAKPNPE